MRHPLRQALLVTLLACLGASACAAETGASATGIVASEDGRELLDRASGQAWSRCVEGMHWDGRTCQGKPALVTHREALAAARARSEADGLQWRVPRVPEFKHFAERLGRAQRPATLAPAAPTGWYWTSSARIDSATVNPYSYRNVQRGVTESQANRLVPQAGWVLDPATGEARGDVAHRERLPLRLVRNLAP